MKTTLSVLVCLPVLVLATVLILLPPAGAGRAQESFNFYLPLVASRAPVQVRTHHPGH